jgi:hypothetical protein
MANWKPHALPAGSRGASFISRRPTLVAEFMAGVSTGVHWRELTRWIIASEWRVGSPWCPLERGSAEP